MLDLHTHLWPHEPGTRLPSYDGPVIRSSPEVEKTLAVLENGAEMVEVPLPPDFQSRPFGATLNEPVPFESIVPSFCSAIVP